MQIKLELKRTESGGIRKESVDTLVKKMLEELGAEESRDIKEEINQQIREKLKSETKTENKYSYRNIKKGVYTLGLLKTEKVLRLKLERDKNELPETEALKKKRKEYKEKYKLEEEISISGRGQESKEAKGSKSSQRKASSLEYIEKIFPRVYKKDPKGRGNSLEIEEGMYISREIFDKISELEETVEKIKIPDYNYIEYISSKLSTRNHIQKIEVYETEYKKVSESYKKEALLRTITSIYEDKEGKSLGTITVNWDTPNLLVRYVVLDIEKKLEGYSKREKKGKELYLQLKPKGDTIQIKEGEVSVATSYENRSILTYIRRTQS